MLPTFFVAGVPKAGTTSMYNYLRQHPEIYMSRPKEPHYFSWEDEGWPVWAVRDADAYRSLFEEADPDQERGEASTWTLYSEGAPQRIEEAVPDARFVVLLRDPVERAYSNWSFNFGKGYDPIATFEDALEAEAERKAGGSPWHHHYLAAGRYHDQVKRYIDTFGRSRVLVLLFEDLKQDARGIAREAYEFLGVDASFQPDVGAVHNATYFPRVRWLHDFAARPSRLKETVKQVVPERLRAKLGREVRSRNKRRPPRIAPQTRRRLNEHFRDDVYRLSELLDRDLSSAWLD